MITGWGMVKSHDESMLFRHNGNSSWWLWPMRWRERWLRIWEIRWLPESLGKWLFGVLFSFSIGLILSEIWRSSLWVFSWHIRLDPFSLSHYANVAHLFYPSSTSLSRGLVLNKCTLKYAVRAQHTTFTAYHHQSLFPSMDDGGNASRRRQNETYTIWWSAQYLARY